MWSPDQIREIEKRIRERETPLQNGCIQWGGTLTKNNVPIVMFDTKLRRPGVTVFKYQQSNAVVINNLKFRMKRTCETIGCTNLDHHELVDTKRPESPEDTWRRLLKKTKPVEEGCLAFPLTTFFYKGKNNIPHRVSYILNKNNCEPIPKKDTDGNTLVIRHMCRTPTCVNPEHLEIGTITQNLFQDRIRDGTINRGEKNPVATITEELASKIKLSRSIKGEEGYKTQKERAEQFGVSGSIVSCIDSGISWSYIPDINGYTTGDKQRADRRSRSQKSKERIWSKDEYSASLVKLQLYVKYTSENKKDPNIVGDCWEWMKGHDKKNYGYTTFLGRNTKTHVLACEAKYFRRKRDDEVTRHLCGNHICCSPGHLVFGTLSQNTLDTIKHNGGGKRLREEDVLAIRASLDTNSVLNKRYKVSVSTIKDVRARKSWKHI